MSIFNRCCSDCEHVKVCMYSHGANRLDDAVCKIPIDLFGPNFTLEIKCKYFKMNHGSLTNSACISTRDVDSGTAVKL